MRKSGKSKNSGISSLTSLSDFEEDSSQAVEMQWKVRSGISKFWPRHIRWTGGGGGGGGGKGWRERGEEFKVTR